MNNRHFVVICCAIGVFILIYERVVANLIALILIDVCFETHFLLVNFSQNV